jgi:hypothetical protein
MRPLQHAPRGVAHQSDQTKKVQNGYDISDSE